MTSFLSNIAATGGASSSRLAGPSGGLAHGAAAEAPAPPSGYSSDGGSHPSDFLAGKERRMECGSAYDGEHCAQRKLLGSSHAPQLLSSHRVLYW